MEKTVVIPVEVSYQSDDLIGGMERKDLKRIMNGTMTVMFQEVPEDMAKDLIKLTWAASNDKKKEKKRTASGKGDVSLDEFPMEFQDDGSNDPDRGIMQREAEREEREMIEYLERKHKYYGEIFRERLEGNFNRSSIAKKLGIPKSNVIRWYDEITELAMKKYKEMNSI